jgi:ribosomal protein S18 acetylase RimI-like enzyme
LKEFLVIQFVRVEDQAQMKRIADLARTIWSEHYPSIIGQAQVDYMLVSFHSLESIQKQIQQEGYRFYFVLSDGDEAGYFAIQSKKGELFLSKFYLSKEYRGLGLSRQMMGFIESIAKENGLKRICLTTHKRNEKALRAYKGLGFKIVGPVLTDIGEGYIMDDYQLEKTI